jgi:hypothetical protein
VTTKIGFETSEFLIWCDAIIGLGRKIVQNLNSHVHSLCLQEFQDTTRDKRGADHIEDSTIFTLRDAILTGGVSGGWLSHNAMFMQVCRKGI